MIFNDILISVTSVPRRINTSLVLTIESILKQSVQCKIIINIPYRYKKYSNYILNIPNDFFNNDNIIVNRTVKDYGPQLNY